MTTPSDQGLQRAKCKSHSALLHISDSDSHTEEDDGSEPESDKETEPNKAPQTQSDFSIQCPAAFTARSEDSSGQTKLRTDGDLHIHSVIECDCVVITCQFSNDGSLLAVGLYDGSIKVHSTDSGELTQTLRDSSNVLPALPVTGLRFTQSGQSHCLLLATYASGSVRCWYVWGGQCLWWLREASDDGEDEIGVQRQTLSLAISPSGKRAVTCGSDAAIYLYDLTSQQRLQICRASSSRTVMDGHRFRVFAVNFHPERETEFISGGWDNTIQFWDTRQEHAIRKIFGPHVCGEALQIDSSVNQILSGSWRKYNTLEVWDYDSCKKVYGVPEDQNGGGYIYTCHWFGKDHIIAAGGQENMLRVIDRHSLKV
ncbi:WD repeat-containing protein 38-like isoform X2 [Hoplias malabaricus]|uniref:WD repeat-containing protein 38-like isoform X2 n=1 Tax=Hoplias malabaricus TaxID=27720 RepID=UPI003461E469